MEKVINLSFSDFSNGAIFRFKAQWPYEDLVDLMLVSIPDEDSEFGLIVTTGHKSGLLLVRLPKECESMVGRGVRYEWLISNWEKWIYPECDISDVYFLEHYPTPSISEVDSHI